jgi:sterol desaturase/sphingolipid hydroxylase (fatty acid hydroxylase superfamily)
MTLKERLSYFRSFWIFPLLAAGLLFVSLWAEPQPRGRLILFFALGVFLWTFLEYLMHRFLFHVQLPFRNPRVREVINGSHFLHHASPRDRQKILVHPTYGIVVSSLIYGIIYVICRNAVTTVVILSGVWAGFLYYEAVHYRVHFTLSASPFIAHQRKAHFYHHFTNNKRCFGVTTPLWDYVFGTTANRPL